MRRFIVNRLLNGVVILAGICLLNFLLFHFSPGDAANRYFGPGTNPENRETLREQLGTDQPWYTQMWRWMSGVLQGDWGVSHAKRRPVVEIVGEALPATLQLTTAALALNFLLGCAVGVISGIFFRRWWGRALDGLSLVFYALPVFWLALLAIWLFSVTLQWLPASGMNSLFIGEKSGWRFWIDRLRHLLLPATVLGVTGAAATARYVRGSVQTVLRQEYVRLAFAKGLPRFKIYVGHVLRNGLLPVITLMGIYFPFLLSGAFVTEVIFAWPGLGRILYEAVSAQDYPVLMAVNFMGAVFVIVGNLLADLLYRFADPRIQLP